MDFETVAHLRGPKLADLTQHVVDVLRPEVAAGDEFVLGDLPLESYVFVPYALSGLGAAMSDPGEDPLRATTRVTLPIADDAGGRASVSKDITVYGPGDVLGLDRAQVVRRYPTPGTVNAEETFHAHIEFDRPELPWAFSAESRRDGMRPWLALVVLEAREVRWEVGGLHPVIEVAAELLPPLGDIHRWAHAQTVPGSASLGARLSTAHGPVNVSRLVASRVLTESTDYVACVVPTTDAGARAGLVLSGGTLDPAWSSGSGLVRLPVYDHWTFRTAPDGDFASLARKLVAVTAPWQVGRRTLDTSRPGAPLEDLPAEAPGARQVIRCALYAVTPPPASAAEDAAAWDAATTQRLKDAVEAAATRAGTGPDDQGAAADDLPIVGPRLYAQGQRGAATLPAGTDPAAMTDWFAQLNLSPVHRVVAGVGTRVVQRDADQLMQAAWAQVGEIDAANQQLRQAQLARHLAASLHARLARVDDGRLLQLTRPVAPRVRMPGAALTLLGQEARSATPVSALGSAMRRTLRAQGPVTRRLPADQQGMVTRVVADAGLARDFTRTYVRPDGITGLSDTALAALDPAAVATALGVTEVQAVQQVRAAAEGLGGTPSLATTVATPQLWRQPEASFRPGEQLAQQVADRLRAVLPEQPAREPVAARWLGGLAAGLVTREVAGSGRLKDLALDLQQVVVGPGRGPVRPPVTRPGAGRGGRVVGPLPGPVGRVTVPVRGGEPLRGGGIERLGGRTLGGEVLREGAAWRTGLTLRTETLAQLVGGRVREVERPRPGSTEAERLQGMVTPAGRDLAGYVKAAQAVTVEALRADLHRVIADLGALQLPTTPERPALAVTRQELTARLDPARTVVEATRARLHADGLVPPDWFADTLVRPIMAAPRFDRPMYRALADYSTDWLVPGLEEIQESDFVTVLAANAEFTESFLVGLSDEMGRELLWREYPTDQRGTYFHRFWNGGQDELTGPVHRFGRTRLGSHVSLGGPGDSNRAVVLVKGEVVRRYPDLAVMALREQGTQDGLPRLPEAPTAADAAPALFYAPLPPDVLIAGLDISIDTLRGGGWWVVLAEHPQAPRFRCAENERQNPPRFATGTGTGADVAKARLANPNRIAFEASSFLPPLR